MRRSICATTTRRVITVRYVARLAEPLKRRSTAMSSFTTARKTSAAKSSRSSEPSRIDRLSPSGRLRAAPDPYNGRRNLPTLAVCELSNGPADSDRFPKVPREQPFAPPYAAHGQAIPGCGVLSPRGSNLPWFSKPRRRHLLCSPEIGNPPSNSSTIWPDNVNRKNRHFQLSILGTGKGWGNIVLRTGGWLSGNGWSGSSVAGLRIAGRQATAYLVTRG